jgi:hypothetical protein
MDSALNPKPPSRAFGCFLLPFFGLGFFFVVMLVREAIASGATYTWQAATCQIIDSKVLETTDRGGPWFAYLRYASSDAGSASESVRSSRPFGNYRDAVLFTRRWPAGSRATCYLDPADPAGALLERKSSGLVLLLFLPLPLLFVFIGAVGFYNVVFRVKPKPPRIRRPNPIVGRRVIAGLVLMTGSALFLIFLLGPVRHAVAARSWRAKECKILRSEVREVHTSKGSDSFSPLILYSYVLGDGEEHRADRYSFFEYSAGWDSARSITSGYRPGSSVTCYVNPGDADEATLNRNPSWGWLFGLLPLAVLWWGRALWPRPARASNV